MPSLTSSAAPAYPPLPVGWTTPPVPQGWARATVVVACLWTLLQLLSAVASYPAAQGYATALAAGQSLPVHGAYSALTLVLGVVQVAALVVTGCWIWRGRRYAEYLTPGARHARGIGWAWCGWVVPVVCYWFPYQVVRDLRAATLGQVVGHGSGRDAGSPVPVWWCAWVLSFVVGNPLVVRLVGERMADPTVLPSFEVVLTVVTTAALASWIAVVREITRVQQARAVPRR